MAQNSKLTSMVKCEVASLTNELPYGTAVVQVMICPVHRSYFSRMYFVLSELEVSVNDDSDVMSSDDTRTIYIELKVDPTKPQHMITDQTDDSRTQPEVESKPLEQSNSIGEQNKPIDDNDDEFILSPYLVSDPLIPNSTEHTDIVSDAPVSPAVTAEALVPVKSEPIDNWDPIIVDTASHNDSFLSGYGSDFDSLNCDFLKSEPMVVIEPVDVEVPYKERKEKDETSKAPQNPQQIASITRQDQQQCHSSSPAKKKQRLKLNIHRCLLCNNYATSNIHHLKQHKIHKHCGKDHTGPNCVKCAIIDTQMWSDTRRLASPELLSSSDNESEVGIRIKSPKSTTCAESPASNIIIKSPISKAELCDMKSVQVRLPDVRYSVDCKLQADLTPSGDNSTPLSATQSTLKTTKEKFSSPYESGESLKCPDCGFVANRQSRLNIHIEEVHRKPTPYSCSVCGFSTPYINILNQHFRRHVDYKCKYCNYKTTRSYLLKRHESSCTGAETNNKTSPDPVTDAADVSKSETRSTEFPKIKSASENSETKNSTMQDPQTKYSVGNLTGVSQTKELQHGKLDDHITTNTKRGDKIKPCSCGFKSTNEAQVDLHMLSSNCGQKVCKCKWCGRQKTYAAALSVKQRHYCHPVPVYSCEICGHMSPSVRGIRRHIRTAHYYHKYPHISINCL